MAHSDKNFKVNPDLTNDKFTKKFNKHNSSKKHFAKKHYDEDDDFEDFAYMSRGNAKNELRHYRETYGI